MDSSKIISSKDMMKSFGGFSVNANSLGEEKNIFTVWKKVVLGIHSYKDESENNEKRMPIGERLAGNTRVVDLKNGTLLVETDHPGWIQYLNMYKKFILRGINMYLPELKVKNLAFRTSGSSFTLNGEKTEAYDASVKKARDEMLAKMEETEKEIEKLFPQKAGEASSGGNGVKPKKNPLPPELLVKLENIRQTMLTNSENK